MFRKMPFILLGIILLAGLLDAWVPLPVKSFLYAVSLTIKSCIVFVLPFLIFGLLFKTSVMLSKKASKLIFFIVLGVTLSNFASTMISYGVGRLTYVLDLSMVIPAATESLLPAWDFSLPKLIDNGYAMVSGLLLGLLLGNWKPMLAEQLAIRMDTFVTSFLKGFLTVIPIFILGFSVKMYHDQVMTLIIQNYAVAFSLVGCAVFSYIFFVYFCVNNFQYKAFVQCLKNMFPATVAGFGSMSSAAAMPLTIIGAEKNSKNPDLAKSIIPATVNMHLVGDCFSIPIFAFAIMKNFGFEEPTFFVYLWFALNFVFLKFSVAAVPGGGVLVMLPILDGILGFNPEMLSLITALYILFDPIITSANVLGNGALAMVLEKTVDRKAIPKTEKPMALTEST